MDSSQQLPRVLNIYFGWVADEDWKKVARAIFERYASPLLRASLTQGVHGIELSVERASLSALNDDERTIFYARNRFSTALFIKKSA